MKSFKQILSEMSIPPVGAIQPSNPDPRRAPQQGERQFPREEQTSSQEVSVRQPDQFIPSISWHDAVRSNAFGLSDDSHKAANNYLTLIYKTARDPFSNANALEALHNTLKRGGVDPNHPHMKEIMSMYVDTKDILLDQQNRKMMHDLEGK